MFYIFSLPSLVSKENSYSFDSQQVDENARVPGFCTHRDGPADEGKAIYR